MVSFHNPDVMHGLAQSWRKAKIGAPDFMEHLRAFLEGARVIARLYLQTSVASDIDAIVDDLNLRGQAAMADFVDLSVRKP